MYEILKLNKISDKIYEVFDDQYRTGDDIENPDAIIVRSAKMHDMEFKDGLLAVARAGAGTNNIPIPELTEKGVVVFNTPGANANAVKELMLCGMLMASRNILGACNWIDSIKEDGDEIPGKIEKGKSQFAGTEIAGKTLGLIGLGAIGAKVAKACNDLGMTVLGFDPYINPELRQAIEGYVEMLTDVDEIYSRCDYVSLHAPLLDSTRNMINSNTIAKMKDGAILINMARGGLVNNDDIAKALEEGKIRSYVLDFPDAKALKCKNVVAIPHLGASTRESEENCAFMAASQIKDYLENGNVVNSVNFPSVSFQRMKGSVRLAIAYNQESSAKAKLDAILNESEPSTIKHGEKKGVGYALAESKDGFNEDIMDKLTEVDGVFFVRIV